jgi:hypothetical protein
LYVPVASGWSGGGSSLRLWWGSSGWSGGGSSLYVPVASGWSGDGSSLNVGRSGCPISIVGGSARMKKSFHSLSVLLAALSDRIVPFFVCFTRGVVGSNHVCLALVTADIL